MKAILFLSRVIEIRDRKDINPRIKFLKVSICKFLIKINNLHELIIKGCMGYFSMTLNCSEGELRDHMCELPGLIYLIQIFIVMKRV